MKAVGGTYKGETGKVTHVTKKMAEVNFDSGGSAQVNQTSLSLLESQSSDEEDPLSLAIEELDQALS